MFIRLSPAQATSIHGWGSKLKLTLSWQDIERNGLSLEKLIQCKIDMNDLYQLQPDINQLVRVCKLGPHHAPLLSKWKANPFLHLGADLGDVISLRYDSGRLKDMNVTYAQLVENGMTPETMRLMGLSLQDWMHLGLNLEDIGRFTDAQLARVFGMSRLSLMTCFKCPAT